MSFLWVASCAKAQIIESPSESPLRDPREIHISLEGLDLTPLQVQARRRLPGLPDEEVDRLVRLNFQFIFHNKLNRGSFLSTPHPERIVEKIGDILTLNQELDALIREGSRLVSDQNSKRRQQELTREIEGAARKLQEGFHQYFVELRHSSYTVNIRFLKNRDSQFGHYMVLCDRIHRLLTRELDNYFFSPLPGVVQVSDYADVGITVLTESLRRVSRITEEKLQ